MAYSSAYQSLRENQTQIDDTGEMVAVSRQALDEMLDHLDEGIDRMIPAFPTQPLGQDGQPRESMSWGMSLRDWFAASAPDGLIHAEVDQVISAHRRRDPYREKPEPSRFQCDAEARYKYADKMLSVREAK